jgi:alpha-tubulin suppressor-like RCC1 family protein
MWAWGYNNFGQLGLNDTVYRSSPVQIGALTTWFKIAAGTVHNLAIKTDGTLWAWGNGGDGRLGLNTYGPNQSSPVQVGALTTWSQVAGGDSFSLAIKTDGTLWSWGINNIGELGLNNLVYRSSPVQIGTNTNWVSLAKMPISRTSLVVTG